MCLDDECDEGRRAFLAGATGAVVGLAAAGSILGQQSQYQNAPTRVLDDPTIRVHDRCGSGLLRGFLLCGVGLQMRRHAVDHAAPVAGRALNRKLENGILGRAIHAFWRATCPL